MLVGEGIRLGVLESRIIGRVKLNREKNFINECLEDGWGIGEAKWHHPILKRGVKGRFPLVTLLYAHQMICILEVFVIVILLRPWISMQ